MVLKTIANSLKRQQSSPPHWVEITTKQPNCIYYFGPFDSYVEAAIGERGYVEDLKEEGANSIAVKITRCQPTKLTIAEELETF